MRFSSRKSHKPPAIIIISLIDILIVLLIFLMVTTTFRQTPTLNLTLPSSSSAKESGQTEQGFIVTIVKTKPHIYIGDRAIPEGELAEALRDLAAAHPRLSLSLRPDESAPVGMLVKAIDAAKAAGILNFKLETKRKTSETP